MTNQEILEKAIHKAIDGGWRNEYTVTDEDGTHYLGVKSSTLPMHTYHLIYNHDFAKALWGEGNTLRSVNGEPPVYTTNPLWQQHLQQMVIAEDPIKYLGENI